MVGILAFASCKKNEPTTGSENGSTENGGTEGGETIENINEVTQYNILEGTIYETPVYIFKSNIPGPKVAIVGGIHGDEIAGWHTALNLVERRNFQGEVMIIPQAHILADTLEHRYPGFRYDVINTKKHDGITYSDLNRTFGLSKGTVTQQIADAIAEAVESFEPEYIIDLHESRRSASNKSEPLLGDLLIYGNSRTALFVDEIAYEFNQTCLKEGEVSFSTDTNPPVGSFCNYFGNKYPKAKVFTIETNREYERGKDTANLARRIEQQTQILDIFFKTIWQ